MTAAENLPKPPTFAALLHANTATKVCEQIAEAAQSRRYGDTVQYVCETADVLGLHPATINAKTEADFAHTILYPAAHPSWGDFQTMLLLGAVDINLALHYSSKQLGKAASSSQQRAQWLELALQRQGDHPTLQNMLELRRHFQAEGWPHAHHAAFAIITTYGQTLSVPSYDF